MKDVPSKMLIFGLRLSSRSDQVGPCWPDFGAQLGAKLLPKMVPTSFSKCVDFPIIFGSILNTFWDPSSGLNHSKIMIDAEDYIIQPDIDYISNVMMEKYNN